MMTFHKYVTSCVGLVYTDTLALNRVLGLDTESTKKNVCFYVIFTWSTSCFGSVYNDTGVK
jgi:hypothetical protein